MARAEPSQNILVNLTTHLSFSDGSPDSVVFTPNVKGMGRAWDVDLNNRTFLHFPALTINVCPPSNCTQSPPASCAQSENLVKAAELENGVKLLWLLLFLVLVLVLRESPPVHAEKASGTATAAAAPHADRIVKTASKLEATDPVILNTSPPLLKKASDSRPKLPEPKAKSGKASKDPQIDPPPRKQAKAAQLFQRDRRFHGPLKVPSSVRKTIRRTSSAAALSKNARTTAAPKEDKKIIQGEEALQNQPPQPVRLNEATKASSKTTSGSSASRQFTLSLKVVRAILSVDIAYMEALQRLLQALDVSGARNKSEVTATLPTSPDMADSSTTISQLLQLLRDTAGSSRGSSTAVGTPGSNESVFVMDTSLHAATRRLTSQKQTQQAPSRKPREQPEDPVPDLKPTPRGKEQKEQPHEQRNVVPNQWKVVSNSSDRTSSNQQGQAAGLTTKSSVLPLPTKDGRQDKALPNKQDTKFSQNRGLQSPTQCPKPEKAAPNPSTSPELGLETDEKLKDERRATLLSALFGGSLSKTLAYLDNSLESGPDAVVDVESELAQADLLGMGSVGPRRLSE